MHQFGLVLLAALLGMTKCQRAPPVYSMQSCRNPDEYHVIFSTMGNFTQMSVRTALLFLTTELHNEKMDLFPLSEVKCIASSTYCYVTRRLPIAKSPDDCKYEVTLRGNRLRDNQVCGPLLCPNMDTPLDCQLFVSGRFVCPNLTCSGTEDPRRKCQLPAELAAFRQEIGCDVACDNCRRQLQEEQCHSMLLWVSLAGVFLMAGVTALIWAIWRWRTASRYVLLIHVHNHETQANASCRPRLPSRQDAERVRQLPEHSLAAHLENQGDLA